jgi:hypothetical protein
MKLLTKFSSCCLALFVPLVFADDLKKSPEASEPKAAAAVAAKGIVFKVEGGSAPLFLCGSIHLMKEADAVLPEAYEAAYKASEKIVMEVPPEDLSPANVSKAMMKYAFMEKGELNDVLTEETKSLLAGWAKENGVPVSTLKKNRPWLVSLMITQQAYAEIGMKEDIGIDIQFTKRAKQDKKPGSGLETIDDQFKMLSGFDQETQDEMVKQSITEAKTASVELEEMLAAWRAGDTAKLATVMEESFKDVPKVGELLLQQRNARWLPQVEAILKQATPTMIIVGAGHLCGKGSLVELLEKKGFRVVQQ